MNVEFKKKNLQTKIFFTKLLNAMIPSHPRMPKTTDAININNFLNKVFKNKNIGKKIKKFNRKNKNKNFSNISDVINYFLNNKIIENEIETLLLELYFSSKVTKKKINISSKKNKKFSLNKITKKIKIEYEKK